MSRLNTWLLYYVGAVLNFLAAFITANLTGFPVWIVFLTIAILEGIPLLWITGEIPGSIYINESFIGGLWAVLQTVVLTSIVLGLFTIISPLWIWRVLVGIAIILIASLAMFLRTKSLIKLFRRERV